MSNQYDRRRVARLILPAFLLLLSASSALRAQSSLSILDVLQPYDLSAILLSNGHFSVTTGYTGEDKTLIYQEDGSGGRPVNYTSHVHFKVDDILFQLPYELNPITRQSPPDNPLEVTGIRRDTIDGRPRVSALMIGVMPDGDTIRFTLWMEPIKRASGGFIRISAEVHNTTSRARSVGVLMLIDTKIGDNDRAPIISAFGYQTIETEFEQGVPPGMPSFWLGLEGSPTQPGLTARGNVVDEGLIPPDYFLFGNWKDNTAVNAVGLALAQWDERRAVPTGYTDSSILLLWEQQTMSRGERRTRASTEIGLVDSLTVSSGTGAWGGVSMAGGGLGGGGGAGGGCLAFDTLTQTDCADPGYHPYTPDSLQALFLVTNTTAPQMDGTEVAVESLPAGLTVASMTGPVLPGTLTNDVTGVATLTFTALPRLYDTAYRVPIAVRLGSGEVVLRDTLCIFVPGIPSAIDVKPATFLPLCPTLSDTITVLTELKSPRCLPLLPVPRIIGAPADVAQFTIITPTPATLAANRLTSFDVAYTSTLAGVTHNARLVVTASRSGLNRFDRDTTEIISDTIDLRGEGRDAEFFLGDPDDTLDFGPICLGDTALREWTITNVGGCDLTIDRNATFAGDPFGQFGLANDSLFPMTIERRLDGTALVRFAPTRGGAATARLIVRSAALPFIDTLIVTGIGDAPRYTAEPPATIDTLCPDEPLRLAIRVTNPTACDVPLDTIWSDDPAFTVDAASGFLLPAGSARTVFVDARFAAAGRYPTTIHIESAAAGDTTFPLVIEVADRRLDHPASLDFADVRVGTTSGAQTLRLTSSGTAGVEITRIFAAGADAAEFTVTLPGAVTLPLRLEPGATLDLTVTASPADLEIRRAAVIVETTPATTCAPTAPIELTVRGVLPVIDPTFRRYDLDRICLGEGIDTTISIRNPGNAPLTVTAVDLLTVTGRADMTVTGLPQTIGPDSSGLIALTIRPGSLGPLGIDLRFRSDGEPLSPGDTLVRIEGAGVICGTIGLDTVRGEMGARVAIPIRLSTLHIPVDEAIALINEANAEEMALTIGHDASILRFVAAPPSGGGLTALTTPATVTPMADLVRLDVAPGSGDIGSGALLGALDADILLGQTDRTTLDLSIERFAGGWHDLQVLDGLLIAEYCAIDRRYVQAAKAMIRAVTGAATGRPMLQLYLPEAGHAVVRLSDMTGRDVALLLDEEMGAGVHYIPLDDPSRATGAYYATLRSREGEERGVVVIITE